MDLVTAKEIHRALANNRHSSRRIVCFFREILDIDKLDGKYRENENDTESQELLDEVKQLLRQSLDSSDIYTYQVCERLRRKLMICMFFVRVDSME